MKKMYLFSYPKCLQKLKTCCAYVECIFSVNLHVYIYIKKKKKKKICYCLSSKIS